MSAAEVAPDIEREIQAGLKAIGLNTGPDALRQLERFVSLLNKWNRTYNLTAIRDSYRVVSTHLLDSLSVAPYVEGNFGVDVGSGGGFPGIPLAIAFPGRHVTLLDSNQKKTAFLRQAAAELKLANVDVVCARVESWRPERGYEWVISRAFSSLPQFAASTAHLVSRSGVLVAMKGAYPGEEIAALPAAIQVREVIRLRVPGLDAERHLVIMERR